MKCINCGVDMVLERWDGEDLDYYKEEQYICTNCDFGCEVYIEGETPMQTLWYDDEGDIVNYQEHCEPIEVEEDKLNVYLVMSAQSESHRSDIDKLVVEGKIKLVNDIFIADIVVMLTYDSYQVRYVKGVVATTGLMYENLFEAFEDRGLDNLNDVLNRIPPKSLFCLEDYEGDYVKLLTEFECDVELFNEIIKQEKEKLEVDKDSHF